MKSRFLMRTGPEIISSRKMKIVTIRQKSGRKLPVEMGGFPVCRRLSGGFFKESPAFRTEFAVFLKNSGIG